jgi:hypothetical protein
MESIDKLFLIIMIPLTIWFLWIAYQSIKISLDEAVKRTFEDSQNPRIVTVKIVKCSSQFYWYGKIANERDPKKEKEKIFDVEGAYGEREDKLLRTVNDISGPGVKGFIYVEDVILIENEETRINRLKRERRENNKISPRIFGN